MNLRQCSMIMIASAIMAFFSGNISYGQTGDIVIIQDSIHVSPISDGDTIPASWVSPSYSYTMTYDPDGRTHFLFTECRKNGELLKLLAWNYRESIHAPAELMTFNSRTENFPLNPGDTISFYRELDWINPTDSKQLLSNYFALDTLEMIVHLVNAADGSPLAQLDSIGVLPSLAPGMPSIYGSRPIMALVSYVVPVSITADSALIGITVRAEGAGPYHFIRRDGITFGVSQRLNSAEWQEYLAAYSPAYGKRSIDELMKASGREGAMLKVSAAAGSPRDLRITFSGPPDGGRTTVALYNEAGELVFYPYDARTGRTGSETAYRVPAGGAYFVTLAHEGRIVRTQKIIIAQ